MPFQQRATIRVKGLAIGIDLEEEDYALGLHERCRRCGLLFSHESDLTLLLLPGLNMERSVAQAGLDVMERCI